MKKKLLLGAAALLALSVAVTGCGGDEKKAAPAENKAVTLKVGATAVPHAEILNAIKPTLEKEGVKLEVVEFADYVKPNIAVNDKELDATFHQHLPFLDNMVNERGLKLVTAGNVHIEPMGVYSKTIKDLKDVPEGAKVAIPNDPSNGGRALSILESAKLIKLKDGVGVKAVVGDVVGNDKKLQFVEIEAPLLPRSLDDATIAVINSNYAMEAKLNPVKDALFIEPSDSPYANIVAVRQGDEKRPEIEKLMKALRSPEVKKFIEDKYQGAVVPAF